MRRIQFWLLGLMCAIGVASLVGAVYVLLTWPDPRADPLTGWNPHGWPLSLILAAYGLGMFVLAFLAKRGLLDE